jgi:hypothetical protein
VDNVVAALFVVAVYLGPAAIAFAKGHWVAGAAGLIAFPPISYWAAVRLAKPDSVWALRLYDDEKLARARERYGPKAGSAPEPVAAPMLKPEGGTPAGPGWRCLICDYTAPSRTEVERHVGAEHAPAPVESSVAQLQP